MDKLLVRLMDFMAAQGEQLQAQAETQQEMVHHQRDFQGTLRDVLKSHSDQLAAQVVTQQAVVASTNNFQQSLAALLRSQDEQQKIQLAQHPRTRKERARTSNAQNI